MSNVLSGVDLCISYEKHTSALLRYMMFIPAMMQHQTHLVSLTLIRDQFINLLKPIDLVNLKGLEFFVQSIDYIFAWCTYELMKIILCYLLLLTTLRKQTNMWDMKRTSTKTMLDSKLPVDGFKHPVARILHFLIELMNKCLQILFKTI